MGNPEVNGALGLLETYRTSILKVILHGPTWLHQILQNINDECEEFKLTEQNEKNQKYWILMILTDGSILDKQRTIEQIVRASKLPVSIIIVGIGKPEDDFKVMTELDSDIYPIFDQSGQY